MFVEEKKQGEVKHLDAASKLLLEAAALIERRGLPSCAKDDAGRGCVIVSLSECGMTSDVYEALRRLSASFGEQWVRIPSWSDRLGAQGRTDEVVAKMRAVAFSS